MAGKTRKYHLRRQNSTRRRYKGGRFLGKGTYGCTFGFPPLKCAGEPVRKSDEYISKYVVKKEARTEGIKSKWFKKFDPSDIYFLTASTICDLDPTDIQPTNQFGKCHIPIAPENKLIFFKNAGTDLLKFKPTPDQMIPFYQSLPHLFDGLELAHRNRTYHRDIKLPNVVTLQQPDGSFLTRFIDLGIGVTHPIKQITVAQYYGHFYVYWPFDIYFIYRDRFTGPTRLDRLVGGENFSDRYNKFLDKYREQFPNTYYPFDNADGSPIVTYDSMVTILMNPDNLSLTLEKRIELADIYSLGILMLQCFRYFGLTIMFDGADSNVSINYIKPNNKSYNIDIDTLSLPPFSFDATIVEWFHNVSTEIYLPLLILVKEMCNPAPTKRMDLMVAKEYFETLLLPNIELYLTGPQVQNALSAFTARGYRLSTN